MLINSLSLDTLANALSCNSLSSTKNQQLLIVGSLPSYKGFEDLGLSLNPQTYFLAQILILFLLVACILHFYYWLHANYIDKGKD